MVVNEGWGFNPFFHREYIIHRFDEGGKVDGRVITTTYPGHIFDEYRIGDNPIYSIFRSSNRKFSSSLERGATERIGQKTSLNELDSPPMLSYELTP